MTELRTLVQLLDDAAELHGDEIVLRIEDSTRTYAELHRDVQRLAAALAAHGVASGSRIGVSLGNGPDFVATVFAVARLGATLVMVSTAWREREIAHALALTDPTHLVVDGSGAVDPAAFTDRPVLHVSDLIGGDVDTTLPDVVVDIDVALDDVAVMIFSSGTTGLPKAVVHTHRTLAHGTIHWVEALGLTATDRLQIATPPFHILGLLNLLAVVAAGASVRLHRRFDLDQVLTGIGRDGVTIEMAVAPIALAMAAHPELEHFDLSTLRYIMWGATPVTPSIADTITRRTGVPILPAYGASELPVISANPVDRPGEWRLDSVGLAPVGVSIRVVDLDSGRLVGHDTPGELQVHSASVMLGYLNEPDDSIVDGWYATGDVGMVDVDGWVTITDRVKEMIKVNGFQVAPAEVEAVLLGHAAVVDCAVFGVPDERTGEAVVAAVVLADGATATTDDLCEHVAEELATYKRLADVRVVEQIPRLPSGKVLRRELRATHPN